MNAPPERAGFLSFYRKGQLGAMDIGSARGVKVLCRADSCQLVPTTVAAKADNEKTRFGWGGVRVRGERP